MGTPGNSGGERHRSAIARIDLMARPKRQPKRKRLTKAERAAAEAKRLASLLAKAAIDSPLAPPAFLTDPRLAPAFAFWNEYAPRLQALGLLEENDRFMFALLSVYVGDFIAATDDILNKGYSVLVKTISGDRMPRENPSVARRDHAAKVVTELSKSFGLTKLDRLNIAKVGQSAALLGSFTGGLFAPPTKPDVPAQQSQTLELPHDEWARLVNPNAPLPEKPN
jgi:phage terminase small subunit